MKTGFKFFDEEAIREGDLVVVLGGAASGRTTLATNLAVNIARNVPLADDGQSPTHRVTHFDLDRPALAWKTHVDALSDGQGLPIEYRNHVEHGWIPSDLRRNVVVVDPVGVAVDRDRVPDFVRSAKQHAVRQRTTVFLMGQLERPLWHTLDREGWVDPKLLPEWVLEFADKVYYLRRTGAGVAVVRVRGDEFASGPHTTCTMMGTGHGRLTQTG